MNILLRVITVLGNIAYIFWIIRSGINDGFNGTSAEMMSYVGLIILLGLNISLLLRR